MRAFMKMLAPLQRRIQNMIARGISTALDASKKMQRISVSLLGGEQKQAMEFFENYGFTAAPKDGAETLALFFDGDRSHGVVICAADRRYRLVVAQGEVAMYDDQGQKVHLTRAGIVIDAVTLPVTIKSTTLVRVEAPLLECTGEIKDLCDTGGANMSSMRAAYNGHHHNPSSTPPTPSM